MKKNNLDNNLNNSRDNLNIILDPKKFIKIGCNDLDAESIARPSMTYWEDAWRRLQDNKISMISLYLLILLAVMTLIGAKISGHDYTVTDTNLMNQFPSAKHWFGTDALGRDLFARVWIGGRISILIGLIGTIITVIVGSLYGGLSGYLGGKIDHYMMRTIEILSSIPGLVLVILVSLYMGKGMYSLIFALTVTGWMGTARLVRGQVLQLREQEFIHAAVALGSSPMKIIIQHLLPNTLGVLIVSITFSIPGFIFSEAFLSFLGLGVQAPDTSWGVLAYSAMENLMFYPYQLFFPSILIALTMLTFSLLGDGLRDALDPKLRQ